jgi:hypothetical protein
MKAGDKVKFKYTHTYGVAGKTVTVPKGSVGQVVSAYQHSANVEVKAEVRERPDQAAIISLMKPKVKRDLLEVI